MMVDSMRNSGAQPADDFRIVVAEAKRQGVSLSANDEKLIARQADESLHRLGRGSRPRRSSSKRCCTTTRRGEAAQKYRSDLGEQMLAERLRDKPMPKRSRDPERGRGVLQGESRQVPSRAAQVKIRSSDFLPCPTPWPMRRLARVSAEIRSAAWGREVAKVAAEVSEDENTARSGRLGSSPMER